MERLVRNFQVTERIGIHPHMFVLIGLLGENRRTIVRTVETIRRIKPLTLQVAIVTPYPGTPLYEEAKRKGLITSDDWSQYTGFRAVSRTEELSAEELLAARERIIRAHRRAVRWKRLRSRTGLALRYAADGSLARRLARRLQSG
jgi:radical SAM superfamily enzyme YgiQ (UPF0313 family)